MSAIDEIAAERRRQVDVEHWTAEHDDRHQDGDLADAAAHYAMTSTTRNALEVNDISIWPFSPAEYKPKDLRRDLIRAGALIVAEIERLDRLEGR